MSPFRPVQPVPTSVSPLRRPRSTLHPSFVDAPSPDTLAAAFLSTVPPALDINDMVISPPRFPVTSSSSSSDLPAWSFAPSPAASTMHQLQLALASQSHQRQQEQAIVSFNLKDKMGLFLSVCSVLVSIQMFTPTGL